MMILFLILVISILLLRLRLRLILEESKKIVFLGLGYSGIEVDLQAKTGLVQIAGHTIRKLGSKKKPEKRKTIKKTRRKKVKEPVSVLDILNLIPECSRAFWKYSTAMLKSVIVEELQADISAGFESPDVTGKVFGYYQAAYYAVPAVVGRVNYQPNWTDSAFDASVRATLAIPLYKLLYRSCILIFALPLREIRKITIGRKERSHDG